MVLEKEKKTTPRDCCAGFASGRMPRMESIMKCCEGFFREKEGKKTTKEKPEGK